MLNKNFVRKVAAIHDLSGYGRASLTVVIPILSNMGVQVCPLPTAVLSSHSGFKGVHFVDLTDDLEGMIAHWRSLQLSFDAIYSGYLGSPKQVGIVQKFIRDFAQPDQFVLVDPVLGDNGKLYSTFDDAMVQGMRSLIGDAHIITPNLTEAALLLNEPYSPDVSIEVLMEWTRKLAKMGPEVVIITSVPEPLLPGKTAVLAYNQSDDRMWKITCDYLPANYPGTGDAFASILCGALLQGDSLPIAIDRAVHFISMGVRATFGYQHHQAEGILLEKVLPSLNIPVQASTYQLLQ